MASPVAPPPILPPSRQRSFAGPVVLIVLGLLFLMGTMGVLRWGSLIHSFGRFWPVLLIIWGVIKLLEYQQAQRSGTRPPGIGVGGAFLVIFLVVSGLIATQATRVNWDAVKENIDIDGGDFDFLTSGWIPAGSGLPFLLNQFAEAWNGELTLLRFAICEISERRNEVFNLFLADTRLAGHFREDLGLSHLCHQNPP